MKARGGRCHASFFRHLFFDTLKREQRTETSMKKDARHFLSGPSSRLKLS